MIQSSKPTTQCTSSVHTAAVITSSVHTAAMYSHVQLSAVNLQCTLQPTAAIYNHLHCSYTIQCTLQLYYPVHTAANLQCTMQQIFSAHCSYTIQCTLQLHYLVPIPYSAHYIQCTSGPPKICISPIHYWWLVTA